MMKMHTRQMTAWAVALALLAGSGWMVRASAQEEYQLQGNEVAVYNLAGEVEVVPGTGDDTVVRVTRGGDDADQLQMEVRTVGSRNALVVVYPDDRIVYPRAGKGTHMKSNDWEFGDLGKRDVHVVGSGRGTEAWADLEVLLPAGKDLAMYGAACDVSVTDVEGDIGVWNASGPIQATGCRGDLTLDSGSGAITVTGFEGDVAADTGSGAVRVADGKGSEVLVDTGSGKVAISNVTAEEITADTGSGSVEFVNVTGEEIMADTGSGKVRGEGVTGDEVVVDTGSGKIELVRVTSPDLELDTGNGSVDVELLGDVDSLVIDTGSGAVTVKVPQTVGAKLEVDTGSGGIDVKIPMEVLEMEKDYVRGVLGDGDGTIEIDTGSGRVRVRAVGN